MLLKIRRKLGNLLKGCFKSGKNADCESSKIPEPLIQESSHVQLNEFNPPRESISSVLENYIPIEDGRWKKLALKLANKEINIEDISYSEYPGDLILKSRFSNTSISVALKLIGKLTFEEETALFKLLENPETRNFAVKRLTIFNLRLVWSSARKYLNYGFPMEDLVQEGIFGLVKAIYKFDCAFGNRFSTYATWWIRQAMLRAVEDKSRIIRVPVHMVPVINNLARIEKALILENGEEPTIEQLTQEMQKYDSQYTVQKVSDIKKLNIDWVSLDKLIDYDENFLDSVPDEEVISSEGVAASTHKSMVLQEFLESTLEDDELLVLDMHYGLMEFESPHAIEQIVSEILFNPEYRGVIKNKAINFVINEMLGKQDVLTPEEWKREKAKVENFVRKKISQALRKLKKPSKNGKYRTIFGFGKNDYLI
ncbi:RNA polymerase sigma factor RpoD [Mycoplasma haemofelis Ohio2]|uniref:RNA polymerase sigma factor RpoD n=1 Tax=Mycoplasma haemofelis (strain Ohio2) TaxID=859194 RepID=F6FFI0_MYCHI|nr:RNA polymerase sigma factor RpoD [Mycoplasma haemofelis Ohio2]